MEKKKNYILARGKKVYVDKEIFDEYNRLRRRQSYSNNKYRSNTLPILQADENIQSANAEDEAIDNLMTENLLRTISSLSSEKRELIRLYYFDGLSERRISEVLGIPQSTLSYRKERLLAKLKKMINN